LIKNVVLSSDKKDSIKTISFNIAKKLLENWGRDIHDFIGGNFNGEITYESENNM
jgi:hypothetical protein